MKRTILKGILMAPMIVVLASEAEAADWPETLAYLRAREQVTNVYLEVMRPVHIMGEDAREVTAVAFAVDRRHPQYAGKLDLETQLALVCQGSGVSGNCADYVLSTAAHLRELGVEDHLLQTLAERLAPEAGYAARARFRST